MAIALLSGSVALLGDALHNLSDVSTSALVFVGFRARHLPTERYPYGYERAEDLAGIGVALVIWGSALVAGFEKLHVEGTGRLTAASMRTSAADRACSNGAVSLSDVLNDVAPSKSTAS